MGRFQNKVVFITGAARGQGRVHALKFAAEGADIIAVDICEQIEAVPYPMATEDDLAETVRLVEAAGGRIFARKADVRDLPGLTTVVDEGVVEFGRLDIVIANAGVWSIAPAVDLTSAQWDAAVDVCQTGVWHTAKAAVPHIRAHGDGGSMVVTASVAGFIPYENIAHYVSAKHGAIGLARVLARELGKEWIRVNVVCPSTVPTDAVLNEALYRLFCPDKEDPGPEDVAEVCQALHVLPVPWVQAEDIANAAMFLCSEDARYITGVVLPVDGGTDLIQ